MENIAQLYEAVRARIDKFEETYQEKQKAVQKLISGQFLQKTSNAQNFQTQKKNLEEQLTRAESFRYAASCHTQKRRKGYENTVPDFTQLFVLYAQIEENAGEDPAAEELWAKADGAVTYLQNQLRGLAGQEQSQMQDMDSKVRNMQTQLQELRKKFHGELFQMPAFQSLAKGIKAQTADYFISKNECYQFEVPTQTSQMLKFGMIQRPLPVDAGYFAAARKSFGPYFDASTQSVRMPFGFRTDRGVKITLTYPDEMQSRVQNILIGFLFNVMRHYKTLPRRVYYIDTVTYNPEHLGVMTQFVGDDNMICCPRTEHEVDLAISSLMASNGIHAAERENRILIVRDFPDNLSYDTQEKILNICNNADFYKVSVLFSGSAERAEKQKDNEKSAMNGALSIFAKDDYFHIVHKNETLYFSWFAAPQAIEENTGKALRQAYRPVMLGSAYPDRVNLTQRPVLTKGNKNIRIPIGVDDMDRLIYLDMNGVNFASYLMGASGSGKSTLLHTIITGLIRNYHPDDVELWLADFKMGEFAQYMEPRPPHVKYVLMDDSQELVYDFLNLLNQELTRRKQFFSQHSDYKKVEELPASCRMPLIVVIIDEFSLMSQAIADAQDYRLILQNLLSGGRALGFRFIFSSQDYTHGITGLTEMAKSQIQSRLAMKNTTAEIRETLNITSGNMTDQLQTWTETLPPHMVLTSSTENGKLHFSRSQVLYFPKEPGKGTYDLQRDMIEKICTEIQKVPAAEFDKDDVYSYVDKNPFDADGNTLKAFTPAAFRQAAAEFTQKHSEEVFPGDILVAFGEPRRLDRSYVFPIAEENRENMLLLTGAEKICSLSVIRSAIQSFTLQGGNVQLWSYRRNQLFGLYLKTQPETCTVLTDPAEIGKEIQRLKRKISGHEQGNDLIVLMGMDHIREDFEFLTQDTAGSTRDFERAIETDAETAAEIEDIYAVLGDQFEKIEEDGISQNKSQEEIDKEIDACIAAYLAEQGKSTHTAQEDSQWEEPAEVSEIYDYNEDLSFIVGHGPHDGYHFMLCAGGYSDFKKNKLSEDWFRHKMSFRISTEDSAMLFGNQRAGKLPENVCLYDSEQKYFTFRPFLHPGLGWNGWEMDQNGKAVKKNSEV